MNLLGETSATRTTRQWTNGLKPKHRIDRTGFEKPSTNPNRNADATHLHTQTAELSTQAANNNKFPNHIFLLGSESLGDGLTLNDIDVLNEKRGLKIETHMANSLPMLMHKLGAPDALPASMQNHYPRVQLTKENPPLILVDPHYYVGSDCKTARENNGRDLFVELKEFAQSSGIKPRVMLIRTALDNSPIPITDLKQRYPQILESQLGRNESGLYTVEDRDLDIILKRYQDSL